MEYEWDARKARTNLRDHGIDFGDAVIVFEDDAAIMVVDKSSEEERFVTMGADHIGSESYQTGTRPIREVGKMKKEYDFSRGKQGAIDPIPPGKTRITIRIDDDILNWFRSQVHARGGGNYQTMMNNALREFIHQHKESLEEIVRRVVKQEIKKTG